MIQPSLASMTALPHPVSILKKLSARLLSSPRLMDGLYINIAVGATIHEQLRWNHGFRPDPPTNSFLIKTFVIQTFWVFIFQAVFIIPGKMATCEQNLLDKATKIKVFRAEKLLKKKQSQSVSVFMWVSSDSVSVSEMSALIWMFFPLFLSLPRVLQCP